MTTVFGFLDSNAAFFTKAPMLLPYGGFMNTECPPPRLFERILLLREMPFAKRVLVVTCGIEVEVPNGIAPLKQVSRRLPVIAVAAHHP